MSDREDYLLNIAGEVGEFLETRSRSGGGFAPVGESDIQSLSDIIEHILEIKYERDPDGDLPVELTLVDRTRCKRLHAMAVPYLWSLDRQPTAKELRGVITTVALNLSLAQSDADMLLGFLSDRLQSLLDLVNRSMEDSK